MTLKRFTLGLIILGLSAQGVFAQSFCPLNEPKVMPKEVSSLDAFKKIAILDEGRIKPLDTYARNLLLQFSGRTSFNHKPAIDWLARLLFAPATTGKDKVFLINNPDIPMALGIEPEKKRRYSFSQLQPGLQKISELAQVADQIEGKNRSIVEQEVLRVYYNLKVYTDLTYVFTFAFPQPDFQVTDQRVINELGLPENQNGQFSFIDIALRMDELRTATENLETNDPEKWSAQDKALFKLVNSLYQWTKSNHDLPLSIVPSVDPEDESWLSPWDIASSMEFRDPRVKNEISLLRDLAVHYWNGQQLQFDIAAGAFQDSVAGRIASSEQRGIKYLSWELLYNKANFFLWAKLLYGLAFAVFLLSLFSSSPLWRKIAFGLIIAGLIPHAIALVMRIVIMARPPATNLFETFVFVGFISVILGIIIELFNKQWLGIVVASICGLVFFLISGKFSAEGDTMRMLVAVLDSNFWLGTHVLTITIGYAGVCVAGIIGHLYIIQHLVKPKEKKLLDSTYRYLVGTLAFGLAMTFLGTTLGGIWADQSWGRFWGWDPKENGALLIVLWCAIIFHAKIAKMIGPLGVAVSSVLGIIVVMWAWFGVNLLNVGLHSYGFMSGVAGSLAIYAIVEIVFLVSSLWVIRKRT